MVYDGIIIGLYGRGYILPAFYVKCIVILNVETIHSWPLATPYQGKPFT